jgi:hypothetical protein
MRMHGTCNVHNHRSTYILCRYTLTIRTNLFSITIRTNLFFNLQVITIIMYICTNKLKPVITKSEWGEAERRKKNAFTCASEFQIGFQLVRDRRRSFQLNTIKNVQVQFKFSSKSTSSRNCPMKALVIMRDSKVMTMTMKLTAVKWWHEGDGDDGDRTLGHCTATQVLGIFVGHGCFFLFHLRQCWGLVSWFLHRLENTSKQINYVVK